MELFVFVFFEGRASLNLGYKSVRAREGSCPPGVSRKAVTTREDKRKHWAGRRKAGAVGWHRPSGEPHVVSGVQLTLPALLERSGKLWASGRTPRSLHWRGISPSLCLPGRRSGPNSQRRWSLWGFREAVLAWNLPEPG